MVRPKVLFCIFSFLGIIFFVLFYKVRPSFLPDLNPVFVEIPKGSSAQQIAQTLQKKEIVHSPAFFLFLARMSGKLKEFKHGVYLLERNRYWENIHKLVLGQTHKIKVTIPEGWSSYQIGERLEKEGVIKDRESFVRWIKENRLEGMLFPETYFFEPNSPLEMVVQTMVDEFKKNISKEFIQRAQSVQMTELEVVTLASIIEREAQIDSERSLISSVYHQRLKKKWPLEADPTVQYALSEGRYWKSLITYKDLNVVSPYNTYRKIGLPPTPICNPGLKSILAALYPAETKFLYFLADGKGGHYFFSEHDKHIQKKRELRGAKRSR